MKTVTAAEANRRFSSVLREAARGEVITVVSRGRPVATIGPVQADRSSRKSAKAALLKRLRTQPVAGRRTWTREELYQR
ncbi:MAG: type II toxin-antitoxin system prevent-host-death family antitoxin [Acidobacteria bacterium]|nr:type II toxin-antitoxin system prevent-host-death family antitoxin [Acidobacteriota bacterium]